MHSTALFVEALQKYKFKILLVVQMCLYSTFIFISF
jgi:hypothetical protein